jgi:hypothetical protein
MATRNVDRDRREGGRCTAAAEALHQERAVRGDPSCDLVALLVRQVRETEHDTVSSCRAGRVCDFIERHVFG